MATSIKMLGLCVTALLLLFIFTSPTSLSSVFLIAPFLLLFAIISLAVTVLLNKYGFAGPRRRRIAVLVAAPLVLLLVLQSLGQLTLRDTTAVIILFGLGYLYVSRLTTESIR